MTNVFTIANLDNGNREVVAHDDRATALKMVADRLIADCDDSATRARISDCIAQGIVYAEGHKAPRAIFLDADPVDFWMQVAASMTTDWVDFYEGTVDPHGDEA